jgi:putative acetyltransferase
MAVAALARPFTIRPERPDHPEIATLLGVLDRYLASLYPPEANHILDAEALRAPGVDLLAAWCDGRIVGCGAVRRMAAEAATDNRPYGEIKRMVVAPQARGGGAGRTLLAALEARLHADAIDIVRLETGRDQTAAVRLYERAGYSPCAPFGGYPDNGLSLFLGKRLRVPEPA